jgi:hypothetical protein
MAASTRTVAAAPAWGLGRMSAALARRRRHATRSRTTAGPASGRWRAGSADGRWACLSAAGTGRSRPARRSRTTPAASPAATSASSGSATAVELAPGGRERPERHEEEGEGRGDDEGSRERPRLRHGRLPREEEEEARHQEGRGRAADGQDRHDPDREVRCSERRLERLLRRKAAGEGQRGEGGGGNGERDEHRLPPRRRRVGEHGADAEEEGALREGVVRGVEDDRRGERGPEPARRALRRARWRGAPSGRRSTRRARPWGSPRGRRGSRRAGVPRRRRRSGRGRSPAAPRVPSGRKARRPKRPALIIAPESTALAATGAAAWASGSQTWSGTTPSLIAEAEDEERDRGGRQLGRADVGEERRAGRGDGGDEAREERELARDDEGDVDPPGPSAAASRHARRGRRRRSSSSRRRRRRRRRPPATISPRLPAMASRKQASEARPPRVVAVIGERRAPARRTTGCPVKARKAGAGPSSAKRTPSMSHGSSMAPGCEPARPRARAAAPPAQRRTSGRSARDREGPAQATGRPGTAQEEHGHGRASSVDVLDRDDEAGPAERAEGRVGHQPGGEHEGGGGERRRGQHPADAGPGGRGRRVRLARTRPCAASAGNRRR